jgi:phosphate transport system substrate-binding protein
MAGLTGVLTLALVGAACGSSSNNSSAGTTSAGAATTAAAAATTAAGAATTAAAAPATTGAPVSGTLQGSGSSLSQAFQQEAAAEFQKANSGTTITYGGGGSGKGRTDLKSKVVDFAGSDSPYKDTDKPAEPILYFPVLLGPITVSYNLPGVDKLQLSADTVAKIFQREIKTWNDPAIAADNPGVTLPSTNITVAHRSDGSGTTQNFTGWLTVASPSAWKLGTGSTVEWPADTQAGNGNAGVAQIVSSTPGAIGYVDLADAVGAKLKYADVKNQAGKFVTPSPDSATAAGKTVQLADNLTFTSYNSSAPDAYPITAQTFDMVYQNHTDAKKAALIKAWINYLLTDGQKLLSGLNYAPLPSEIQQKALAQLDQLKTS